MSDQKSEPVILHRFIQPIRNSLQRATTIINKHYPAFVGLQIAHHAIVIGAMGLAAMRPELSALALGRVNHEIDNTPGAQWVTDLYHAKTGNTPLAALMTFVVNLALGSFSTITLPSLIVPGSGLLVQAYRAVVWGLIFSPGFGMRDLKPGQKGYGFWGELPHDLTLIVEGQAYVVAALGAWIVAKPLIERVMDLWKSWTSKAQTNTAEQTRSEKSRDSEDGGKLRPSRWIEYKAAVREAMTLYSIITAVLAVSAVWEAYEVIHLVPGDA